MSTGNVCLLEARKDSRCAEKHPGVYAIPLLEVLADAFDAAVDTTDLGRVMYVEDSWAIAVDGNNVKAEFRDVGGQLLGFALTGDATKAKMALQKELPAILV